MSLYTRNVIIINIHSIYSLLLVGKPVCIVCILHIKRLTNVNLGFKSYNCCWSYDLCTDYAVSMQHSIKMEVMVWDYGSQCTTVAELHYLEVKHMTCLIGDLSLFSYTNKYDFIWIRNFVNPSRKCWPRKTFTHIYKINKWSLSHRGFTGVQIYSFQVILSSKERVKLGRKLFLGDLRGQYRKWVSA